MLDMELEGGSEINMIQAINPFIKQEEMSENEGEDKDDGWILEEDGNNILSGGDGNSSDTASMKSDHRGINRHRSSSSSGRNTEQSHFVKIKEEQEGSNKLVTNSGSHHKKKHKEFSQDTINGGTGEDFVLETDIQCDGKGTPKLIPTKGKENKLRHEKGGRDVKNKQSRLQTSGKSVAGQVASEVKLTETLVVYCCEECHRLFTSKKLYMKHKNRHGRKMKSRKCLQKTSQEVVMPVRINESQSIPVSHSEVVIKDGEGIAVANCEVKQEFHRRVSGRLRRKPNMADYYLGGNEYEDSDEEEKKHKLCLPAAREKSKQDVAPVLPQQRGKPKRKRVRRGKASVCLQCGRSFRKYTDLQRHFRIHTGEKPYACEMCNQRFTRNFGLQCHLRTHAGVKPHPCGTCGKAYSRRYDLVKHEKSVHTAVREFVCTHCGKGFVTARLLCAHERTHTNSQPYICQDCGHRSNHQSDLKKHMRTHRVSAHTAARCTTGQPSGKDYT